MITVIKDGRIKECTCPSCKSQLSFLPDDMIEHEVSGEFVQFYIPCAVCQKTILVGWKFSNGSVYFEKD